jgi:hypothetical protein
MEDRVWQEVRVPLWHLAGARGNTVDVGAEQLQHADLQLAERRG